MSSNIKVQRICRYCNREFTARTTVTLYCSDECAKRAYKARKKAEKIELTNSQTSALRFKTQEDLKGKEYLSISETCLLLSVSRWTLWRAIKNGSLNAAKLGRRTLIRRSDLNKLFETPVTVPPEPTEPPRKAIPVENLRRFDITDSYTLTEIQEKYHISESALANLIQRNRIPKIKKGWYTYVPKKMIDELLK